jgi:hypothetical protein
VAMLAAETSVHEAMAAWHGSALRIKDAEDWATLMERETLEKVSRVEVENATVLSSTHEDVEGFLQKIALLEDELATEHRVREVSETECQAQFEDLTLLQTQGFELCHFIVSPPRARHHLSEGMWLAALRHTEEFATLWAVVSSSVDSVLWRSLDEAFHVEVVGELAAEFEKMEDQHSWLEWQVVWVYDLLLTPPPGRG